MKPSDPPPFARRLRALRERAGLTQSELARRAELARQSYRELEAGRSAPAWATACRLADALGVGVQELR